MLNMPKKYYEREVRDGHLVGELIKKAWASQLEILSLIDEICEKHGITYFAYWGSLLGAVRHKGFIPWDDDLDIAMLRPDYTKFLEVVLDEIPEHYHLINNYMEKWDNSFTRLTNRREILVDENEMAENHNCPFALGIDIFPLDYISKNEQEAEEQKQILRFIGILVGVLEKKQLAEKNGEPLEVIQEYNYTIAESLVKLEQLCSIRFERDIPLAKQLNILYDQVAGLFTEEESDRVTNFPAFFRSGYVVNKNCFSEIIRVPFETMSIPIPNGYDAILRKTYSDYIVPRKGTSTHGEICFKAQLQMFADALDKNVAVIVGENEEKKFIDEFLNCVNGENAKKQVIFLHNSTLETIAHDTLVVEKLRKVFEMAENNQDIFLWWRPARIDLRGMYLVEKITPQLVEEYRELIKEFKEKKIGVLDPGIRMQKVLEVCDAYYGDENKVSKVFNMVNKPVMIINYKI